MGVAEEKVTSMRYRGNGWPGKMSVETAEGVSTMDYDTSWGKHLGTDIHTRCKYCADGVGLSADLVFGDAWLCTPEGQPSLKEAPGWSAVIVRTTRGTELLGGASQRGAVVYEPYSIQELSKVQRYQVDRRRTVWARLRGRRLAGATVPRYSRGVRRIGWNPVSPVVRLRALLGAFSRSKRSPSVLRE
jgi:coenzyme F420 hydrogenase subunit beta